MAKLDKICFRILSVSIVLTMCNIEPAMAEVTISDLLRHVVMSTDAYEAKDPELKKLTYFLEHHEQNGIESHQLATIIRIIPISYITYSRTQDLTNNAVDAIEDYISDVKPAEESCEVDVPSSVGETCDILLNSVSPRAGPCC